MDEPTSGLDAIAKKDLLDILVTSVENNDMMVLISSHLWLSSLTTAPVKMASFLAATSVFAISMIRRICRSDLSLA